MTENEIKNEDENENEFEYKFILLGDTSVGKTCLFKKLTFGQFKEKNVSTIGIDRRTFKVNCDLEEKDGTINKKEVVVNLIDTAGQERYKSLAKSYYKQSDAAIILYDITEKKTFNNINNWLDSINSSISNKNNYTVFLMGSKLDLVENDIKSREVKEEEAIKKCDEYQIEWGEECSSKEFSDEKFKEIFAGFVKIIYKKIGSKKTHQETMKLANFKNNTKKKKRC